MLIFLKDNLPSILAGLMVAAVLAVVIHSMVKNKKRGKSSCGCNCAHCAMDCHSKK